MSTPNLAPYRAETTPLTKIRGIGVPVGHSGPPRFVVECVLCGDVTRAESGGTWDNAKLPEANLYRQRHLAKHLTALAKEVTEAAR